MASFGLEAELQEPAPAAKDSYGLNAELGSSKKAPEGFGLDAEVPAPPKEALPTLKPLGEANRELAPLKAPAELAPLASASPSVGAGTAAKKGEVGSYHGVEGKESAEEFRSSQTEFLQERQSDPSRLLGEGASKPLPYAEAETDENAAPAPAPAPATPAPPPAVAALQKEAAAAGSFGSPQPTLDTPEKAAKAESKDSEEAESPFSKSLTLQVTKSRTVKLANWQANSSRLDAWEMFAIRQRARNTPLPMKGIHDLLPETMGYRLRLASLSHMKFGPAMDEMTARGSEVELRVAASLFDEATGSFFGNTCASLPCTAIPAPDNGEPLNAKTQLSISLQQDVYFHTRLVDTRCILVLEYILVERRNAVAVRELSVGWSAVPYCTAAQGGGAGGLFTVKVRQGSPRYLMWGMPCVGHPPPGTVEGAKLSYSLEACPAITRVAPFLPRDFLVTYSDVIPGVARFDYDGGLTFKLGNVVSSLANPIIQPPLCINIKGLCVALPTGLHAKLAELLAPATHKVTYQVRFSVHNGRAFVGTPVMGTDVKFLPEQNMIEVNQQLLVDRVPMDQLTVVILELQLLGDERSKAVCFGWAPFMFFQAPTNPANGLMPAIREGNYELVLRTDLKGWLRDEPLLNWYGLMQGADPSPATQAALKTLAPPTAYFHVDVVRSQAAASDSDSSPERTAALPRAPRRAAPAMSQEEAATSIQAKYRGYTSRKQYSIKRSSKPTKHEKELLSVAKSTKDMAAVLQQQLASMQAAGPPATPAASMVTPKDFAELALAMQAQLNALTEAVKVQVAEAVKSLHTAAPAAAAAPPPPVVDAAAIAAEVEKAAALRLSREAEAAAIIEKAARGKSEAEERAELERLGAVAPEAEPGDRAKFQGGVGDTGVTGMGPGPSRAVRAVMHSAKPHANLPAEVQSLLRRKDAQKAPPARFDLGLEAKDLRARSEVIVQFVAYRKHDTFNVRTDLKSLYFTYQFYDFPPTTTKRVLLEETASPAAAAATGEAGAPMQMLVEEGAADQNPGMYLKYCVGGGVTATAADADTEHQALQARRMDFCRYLQRAALSVDVFDGDSLLQCGTLAVDLAPLLRQGREFAEILEEVPVTDHREALPEEAQRNRRRRGAIRAAMGPDGLAAGPGPAALAQGTLLLRIINVGKACEGFRIPRAPAAPARAMVVAAGHAPNSRRVRPAPDTAGGLVTACLSQATSAGAAGGPAKGARALAGNMRAEMAATQERKRRRQLRLKELRTGTPAESVFPEEAELEVREAMLRDIAHCREKHKREAVARQLRAGLCTTVALRPAYGEVVFFEHEFKNPYAADAVFVVETSSPDLQLVRDAAEWRALRAAAGLPGGASGAEDDAITQGNRLFLVGNERVRVPFKFCSRDPGAHLPPPPPAGAPGAAARERANLNDYHDQQLQTANISVVFTCEADEQTAAVVEVEVAPLPLSIDRTFRFHSAEHEFFKQRLRAPPPPPGAPGAAARELLAHCSDAGAVVGATASAEGGPKDEVYIKYKCQGAPSTAEFFVLLYRDKWMAEVAAVWQVFVHAVRRTDICTVVHQTTASSVVVRGAATSRRVAIFSSHPDEFQAAPDACLLAANALTELSLTFRPIVPGRLDVLLHIVDTDTHELVHTLLVATDARTPTISKSFEVVMQAGATTHKKISYTNPYPTARSFYLRSTHPWLVSFRPERLDLPEHGTKHVGLTFHDASQRAAASALPEFLEVLVFINDDDDKNEECFRIRVDFAH